MPADDRTRSTRMDDLFPILAGESLPEREEEVSVEPVKDLVSANALSGKVVLAERNIERYEAMRKAAIEFVNGRIEDLVAQEERRIARYTEELEPWVRGLIEDNLKLDPKAKKSIDLLYARAGIRKGRDKVEYKQEYDEDALADEAKKLGIFVKVKRTVNKKDVLEYVKKHGRGHVSDFAVVTEAEDHFYVQSKL